MYSNNSNISSSTAMLRHHFALKSQRSSYEELPDAYSPKNLKRGYRRCLTVSLLVGFGLTVWILPREMLPQINVHAPPEPHKETLPTLLQVVNPLPKSSDSHDNCNNNTNFVYALDNPLYDKLLFAQLHDASVPSPLLLQDYRKTLRVHPSLTVALHYYNSNNNNNKDVSDEEEDETADGAAPAPPDALTLTWNLGLWDDGSSIGADDHAVLVLQCGGDILDAATLPQARATHRRTVCSGIQKQQQSESALPEVCFDDNEEINNNSNQWYIPIPSHAIRYEACRFRLYDTTRPVKYYVLAETQALHLGVRPNQPTAIHLAWTERVDTVLVQFVTTSSSGTPVAVLTDSDKNEVKLTGTTTTYAASDLCQAPANETKPGQFQSPGFLHTVALTNLQPNAPYSYKVGLAAGQGVTWSPTYTFQSAMAAGDPTEHAWLVYADQGCPNIGWSAGSSVVAAAAARETQEDNNNNVRAVHHFGDLSYAMGAAHQWDQWFDMIQVFAPSLPLMVAVGNHEYDHTSGGGAGKDPSGVTTDAGFMPVWGNFGDDSGGECGVPTAKRFTVPATGNGVFWYSYDYGLVHTIVVSSEHDLGEGSRQHKWLKNDLKRVDRTVTPWVIVESHRPLYEGEAIFAQNTVGVAMRMEFEDLLYDYRVDVVLAGHYHAYHRTYVLLMLCIYQNVTRDDLWAANRQPAISTVPVILIISHRRTLLSCTLRAFSQLRRPVPQRVRRGGPDSLDHWHRRSAPGRCGRGHARQFVDVQGHPFHVRLRAPDGQECHRAAL